MKEKEIQGCDIHTPVSLESQERLMEIMNNSPRVASFANTEWEIRALRPQVMYWIAEEAVKIEKIEQASAGDVLVGVSKNFDSIVRILTLVLLNDKERIEKEYDTVFELIKWESKVQSYPHLLGEILQMLNLDFFFFTTEVVATFRTMVSERKMTAKEAALLSQGRS